LGKHAYGISAIARAEARQMPADNLEDIIRGAVPLARRIFRDPRKRRLIPQLVRDGWPIFELAGKHCAFPADLDHHIAHVRKTAARKRAAKKS
jgi:hypothetical protein